MKSLIWSAALIGAAATGAKAVTVTMIASNGTSGQHWGTTSGGVSGFWSDGQAAHSGADYRVDAGFTLRAPTTATSSFPGDNLTLNGGQFNLSAANSTVTVSSFFLQAGGVIVNGNGNSTQTLDGTLTIASGETGYIRTAGTGNTDIRNINLATALSGEGTLHMVNRGTVTLSNADNTFSGSFRVGGTNVTPGTGVTQNNSATNHTTLKGTVAGSLGVNASVVVSDFGFFNPDFNWTSTGSLFINTNGVLVLDNADQVLTVNNLQILGNHVSAGTWSYQALRDTYGNAIAAGGESSASVVVVVPEPAFGSLAAGAALLLYRRRRHR